MAAETKSTEDEATSLGRRAKEAGVREGACPFDRRSRLGRAWIRGWLQGEPPENAT